MWFFIGADFTGVVSEEIEMLTGLCFSFVMRDIGYEILGITRSILLYDNGFPNDVLFNGSNWKCDAIVILLVLNESKHTQIYLASGTVAR